MTRLAAVAQLAVPFIWLGMVLAISFLETPLKFRAPGITVPLGLGIGRLVFRALNAAELAFAVALTVALLAGNAGDVDIGGDPTTVLICKFKDGTVGKTASILDCKMPYQFNVDVIGTKGTIRDNRLWSETMLPGQNDWSTIPTILPSSGDVTHHPFNGQIEAFAAGILDGASVLPDLDDAVKTHELIFAAERSAATGRPVKLPLER